AFRRRHLRGCESVRGSRAKTRHRRSLGQKAIGRRRPGRTPAGGRQTRAARDGSHLYEIFPAPWAHLLAEPKTLWELYAADYEGKDTLWPGKSVDREFFVGMLKDDLNRRGVRIIKRILLESGCDLVFWQQLTRPGDRALLRNLRLRRALRAWPLEELLTSYLAFAVRKRPARRVARLRLRFPWPLKQWIPERLKRSVRWKIER
ncbi:hypothetical protein AMJ85_02760, partial [candidate division BRC1 bacterium SM23_51]